MLGFAPSADVLDPIDTPGGFCWWYADLIDASGDGVVVIGAFGLPFLPGQAAAARSGITPRRRPSLNVSVYRGGRCVAYLLTAHDPAQVVVSPGEVRLGESRLSSRTQGSTRIFEADLSCEIPGSSERLTGTIRVRGPRLRAAGGPDDAGHLWAPLTAACLGQASLRVGGRPLLVTEGRAYHDGNGSRVPLDRLGIERWLWGRAPRGDGELVWYALWPEGGGPPRTLALNIAPDGEISQVEARATLGRRRRGRYGFPGVDGLVIDGHARVDHVRVIDDGPFYQRYQARVDGALGFAEALAPARVDLAAHRPLVRMAVHELDGANSTFLPLFSGTVGDRWSRLVDWNLGRLGGAVSRLGRAG